MTAVFKVEEKEKEKTVVVLFAVNIYAHLKSSIGLVRGNTSVSNLLQPRSERNGHQMCISAGLPFLKVSVCPLISISQTRRWVQPLSASLRAFITWFSILHELLIACFKGRESQQWLESL